MIQKTTISADCEDVLALESALAFVESVPIGE